MVEALHCDVILESVSSYLPMGCKSNCFIIQVLTAGPLESL